MEIPAAILGRSVSVVFVVGLEPDYKSSPNVHFAFGEDFSAQRFHLRLREEKSDTACFTVFVKSFMHSKQLVAVALHVDAKAIVANP